MKLRPQLLILAGACLFFFFVNLGAFDPDLMEARNFRTAQEILDKDNWLMPTMNGELRLKKPPLPTWITAVTANIGGRENLFALRFPAAVAGSLLVLFMFLLGRELSQDKRFPLWAALLTGSSLLVIQMGRTGSWDVFCYSFMLGAVWALCKAWRAPGSAWSSFALAGLLMAASFMSKGPVAFYGMLLPFLICYAWAQDHRPMIQKWQGFALTLVLAALLSALWPLYIQVQHPDLLVASTKGEMTSWMHRHVRPWYFYGHFELYIGGWLLFFLPTLVWPYARRIKLDNYKFYFSWMLLCLVLLSIIPEKKERYLLPLLVPMSLLTLTWILYLVNTGWEKLKGWEKFIVRAHLTVLLLGFAGMPVYAWIYGYQANDLPLLLFMLICVCVAGFIWLTLKAWSKSNLQMLFGLTVGWMCMFTTVTYPFIPTMLYVNPNYKSLREARDLDAIKGMPLFSLGEMGMTLIYELGLEVRPWNYTVQQELPAKLPLAVFSVYPPENLLTKEVLGQVRLELVDTYDPYREKTKYVWHLTVLYPK